MYWPFFHGGNTGSNPVGDAKSFQQITVFRRPLYRHKKGTNLASTLMPIGQSEPEPIVVRGVDTIVASSFATALGHSYFTEGQTIVPDLYYLLRTGSAPSERPGLFPSPKEHLVYWTLRA